MGQPEAPLARAFDWERFVIVALIGGGVGLLALPVYCAYFWWIFSKLTN